VGVVVAKVKSNILLDGVSGKVGESLVFRQVRGVTIVAKAPDVSRRTVSPAAKKHLNKFQRAKIGGIESHATNLGEGAI